MATDSNKKRLIVNAAINWVGTLAQMVAVFVVSPILVKGLGDQRYGVWALVESILAYLTLFDLGIGAAVVRYVAKFEGAGDIRGINRTFNASLLLFAGAGLGVMGVAWLILGPLWTLVPVPREFTTEAWWQMAILSFNLAIGLPMGVFAAVLDGLQLYVPKTTLRMISLVLRSVAMVVVVRAGGGLLSIGLTVTAVALAEHLILAVLAFWYLPGLRFSRSLVDRDAVRLIGGYSLDAFVAMVAGRISFQTDAIVIAMFLPLSQITYFALPARLCEHVKGALRSLTTVLTPHISRLEGQNDFAAIQRIYIKGTRYVLWLILPVQLGIWFLGKPFFRLWIGPEHAERCFPALAILAAPLALTLSQSIAGRILYGTGNLQRFSRLLVFEALANLILSLLLVKPLGVAGVALGTAVPNFVASLMVVHHMCATLNLPIRTYLRSTFIGPILVAIAPACVWVLSDRILPIEGWLSFVAVGLVGTLAYFSLALLLEVGPRRLRLQLLEKSSRISLRDLEIATKS